MPDLFDRDPLPTNPPQPNDDDSAWDAARDGVDSQPDPQPTSPGWQPPPASPEPPVSLRDQVASRLHLDLSGYQNDEEFVDDFARQMQSIPSREELAELQQFREQQQDFYAWQESQSRQQPTDTPEPSTADPSLSWKAPALSEATQQLMQRNAFGRTAEGRIGVFDPYSQQYVENPRYANSIREMEEYIDWEQSARRKMLADPMGVLREAGFDSAVEARAREIVKQELEALQQQQAEQARHRDYETFMQQNEALLFETNGGQVTYRMLPGGQRVPVLTDVGRRYQAAFSEAREYGITDETQAHRYALKHSGLEQAKANANGQTQPNGREQQRQRFLDNARTRSAPEYPVERSVSQEAARSTADADRELSDDDLWERARSQAVRETSV